MEAASLISHIRSDPHDGKQLSARSRAEQARLEAARARDDMPSLWKGQVSICDAKRFLWYRVPKAATRTVYYHLKRHVTLDCDHPYDFLLPLNLYRDYFKFTIVRNPWDRLVSCWSDKFAREKLFTWFDDALYARVKHWSGFLDWLAELDLDTCDAHMRRQSRLVDLGAVDFVGRLESFDADYAAICARIGVPLAECRRLNVSDRRGLGSTDDRPDYRAFYSDAQAELVGRLYRRDIQIFGYRF